VEAEELEGVHLLHQLVSEVAVGLVEHVPEVAANLPQAVLGAVVEHGRERVVDEGAHDALVLVRVRVRVRARARVGLS